MNKKTVVVCALFGKSYWVMDIKNISKFNNIRILGVFFILTVIYLTSGITNILGGVAPVLATAIATNLIYFLDKKDVKLQKEKELATDLEEIYSFAQLILFLAVVFSVIVFVQRGLRFYEVI